MKHTIVNFEVEYHFDWLYIFFNSRDPVSIKDEFVNIDWNPVSTDEFSYLDIGEELQIFPVPEHLLFFEQAL